MRLKEDSTSYRASGIRRRDERHQKPPDDHRPVAGKKNTRRWCGGKVGREHMLVCMAHPAPVSELSKSWRILTCTVCGKELAHYFPWTGRRNRVPKPAWVTF